jgi:hypothetical protein
MIALSAYTVLLRDVEQYQEIEKLSIHAYANMFLLLLMAYYIVGFPVFHLIPHDLYFPFLNVKDKDAGLIYKYSIGPGYVLNLFGFICITPYTMFYYTTVMSFSTRKQSGDQVITSYIQKVQDPIDLDKLIANEQLKLKFNDPSFNVLEEMEVRQKPLKRRIRS